MYGCETKSPLTISSTRLFGVGGGHQQPAEKLAGNVARNGCPAAAQTRCLDHHRRAARSRVRETARRPSCRNASSRSSIGRSRIRGVPSSRKRAMAEGQHGREEPHRGAAVGHITDRLPSPAAGRRSRSMRMVLAVASCSTAMPSWPQRLDHYPGVFAIQCAGQHRFALGQGGADQRPVGDAFRAGRANRAEHGAGNRLDFHGK